MEKKPTYEELQERVKELEKEAVKRRQSEEKIKESERKFHTAVENSPDFMVLIKMDGTIFEVNRLEKGFTREMVIGQSVFNENFYQNRDQCEFARKMINDSLITGKTTSFEYSQIAPDGSLSFYETRLTPFEYDNEGKVISLQLVTRDITKRKKMEEALRESEEKYRGIVETTSDVIWELDTEGNYLNVSPKMKEILGYTPEELIGQSAFDFIVTDEAEKLKPEWAKIVDEGKPFRDLANVMLHKDGHSVVLESRGVPFFDEEGKLLGFRGVDTDITERVKAEDEKESLQAQLQRAQKMEAIGTLAGGVAHDLNNILAGLVSYPELLLLEIPEDSPLRNPILTIQKSGEKAAAIVQDLLTLSRRGVAVTEVVNLNDIISEYVKSPEHERLISFHANVHVGTDLEADLLNILASPAHLSKTIMNLVSNAAEAMPDGGEISISTENRYIDRPVRGYDNVKEGDYVVLRVSDTGVGISKKGRERIFEPFYTKKAMGRSGTGLGMAVVWGTAKDHKGYIDIESAKGKGATFTLYFPVSRKVLPKDKALVSIDDYMGKGESILVVDDVEEQREIASKILKKLGYSVAAVSSGEEAVDYLKDNSPDLLILDMIMDPGIDGLETYKRIIEFHPNQKALIVSGFSETKRVKEAQRLGAGAYVKKPFLLEKIGLAVRDELER